MYILLLSLLASDRSMLRSRFDLQSCTKSIDHHLMYTYLQKFATDYSSYDLEDLKNVEVNREFQLIIVIYYDCFKSILTEKRKVQSVQRSGANQL